MNETREDIDFIQLKEIFDKGNADSEYAALEKRMNDVGSLRSEVTMTQLWFWLTDKDRYGDLGDVSVLSAVPPVQTFEVGSWILSIGNVVEIIIKRVSKNIFTFIDKEKEPSEFKSEGISCGINDVIPVYTISSTKGFWENFFGCDDFLNGNPQQIPRAIIGGSELKNHSRYGGEWVDVSSILERISKKFSIPYLKIRE